MEEPEEEFNERETEEILEALYRPGSYQEAEAFCLEILEDIDPDWHPARLYLLLCWAAQDLEDEALGLIDELPSEHLFEALQHLPFGSGAVAEESVYEDIRACLEERGKGKELRQFFATVEKPLARQDIHSSLSSWE